MLWKISSVLLLAGYLARGEKIINWDDLQQGRVFLENCDEKADCKSELHDNIQQACGLEKRESTIREKSTFWNTGWRRLASGLSGLGQSPQKALDAALDDKSSPTRWLRFAGYFFIEDLITFWTILLAIFGFLLLPFLLLFNCGKAKIPKYDLQPSKELIKAQRDPTRHKRQIAVVIVLLCLFTFTVLLAFVHTWQLFNHIDEGNCEIQLAYDDVLYSGFDQNVKSLTHADRQLDLVDRTINAQVNDGLPNTAELVTSSFLSELFAEVLTTNELLSDRQLLADDDKFTLNLNLAMLLDPDNSVYTSFNQSYGLFIDEIQNNLNGVESNQDSLKALEDVRNQLSDAKQTVHELIHDLTTHTLKPFDLNLIVNFTDIIMMVLVTFIILSLLTIPFIYSRVSSQVRYQVSSHKAIRIYAAIMSLLWAIAGVAFLILSVIGLATSYVGSLACDHADDIISGKQGYFANNSDHLGASAFRHECILRDTGRWAQAFLFENKIDLASLSRIEPADPEVVETVERIAKLSSLEPMFGEAGLAWNGWDIPEERTIILPAISASTQVLADLVGPELAMASIERYTCPPSNSKLCKVVSSLTGHEFTQILGIEDIENAIDALLTEDVKICFADRPGCDIGDRYDLVFGLNNVGRQQPTLSFDANSPSLSPEVAQLMGYLRDHNDSVKAASLLWHGTRLAAVYKPHIRAPTKFTQKMRTSVTKAGYVDPCPPSYACPLFVNNRGFVGYNQWKHYDLHAFVESGLLDKYELARLAQGFVTSSTGYETLVYKLQEDYQCKTVVSKARALHDTVCGDMVGDVAALGFAWLGFGLFAFACMCGIFVWRNNRYVSKKKPSEKEEKEHHNHKKHTRDNDVVVTSNREPSVVLLGSPRDEDTNREQFAEVNLLQDML